MVELTSEEFDNTFTSNFNEVTETAENFNGKDFDQYVKSNLIDELGVMQIEYIYDTKDGNWRHVIFKTQLKNINYVVVIDINKKTILGHHVLDLNEKYGLNALGL